MKLQENKYSNGFTLIELLVVIAIIALLMGILMPALNRAKGQAHKIVCMANVRRLGVSMNLYLDGNENYFPPDRIRGNWVGCNYVTVGPYKRYNPRWIWFLNEGMGFVINPYKYSSEAEFNAALEMDNDYYTCPSMRDYDYLNSIRNGSYGFNYQYLSNTRKNSTRNYSNYPNTLLRVKRPTETVLFCDSRGAGIPHGEHAYLVDPPKMAVSKGSESFSPKAKDIVPIGGAEKYSPADARHFGKVSVVFLDGHAEAMTYEELGYEVDPETKRPIEKENGEFGGGGNNRLWTGTGKDEPDIN